MHTPTYIDYSIASFILIMTIMTSLQKDHPTPPPEAPTYLSFKSVPAIFVFASPPELDYRRRQMILLISFLDFLSCKRIICACV